jgi:hypothetical protein
MRRLGWRTFDTLDHPVFLTSQPLSHDDQWPVIVASQCAVRVWSTDACLSGMDFGPVLGGISGTKSAKKLHYFVNAGLAFLSLFELSVPALARAEAQIKNLPRY